MASCELCHHQVMFYPTGKTKNKKKSVMPVDPIPTPKGLVVLEVGEASGEMEAHVLTKDRIYQIENPGMFDDPPPERFNSHFATCEFKEKFRRCGKCHRTPCECPGGIES